MKTFRHISFDVWNTLIKPNKKFSTARNQMIADTFDLPVDTVKEQYTETKSHLDRLARDYGLGCNTTQAWHQLIERLSEFNTKSNSWSCDTFVTTTFRRTLDLFRKHPPIVDVKTIEAVRKLRSVGITINVSSNSNFVPGSAMRLFLEETFGSHIFEFFVFSDQIGIAKPSFQFFQNVKSQIAVPVDQILHVGDDRIYDKGSEVSGIRFAHIDERHTVSWLANQILSNKY